MNEDCADYRMVNGVGCWAVADGLGGHGRGDVASAAAVKTVVDSFLEMPNVSQNTLNALMDAAHNAVLDAQRIHDYPGMRTTLSLLLADADSAISGHVGDTRIYQFRRGQLVHQSLDHSVPQMLVEAGELTAAEVRSHPDRSRILRALGQEDPPRMTVAAHDALQERDAFLMCTDGWWELVTEPEMEADFAEALTPHGWLDRMADRILHRGTGEFDNLTAIAAYLTTG